MGMADMVLCDRLEELRAQIGQQHLIYLEQDDKPRKIEVREKLENSIREFLYLAPHNRKFDFRQTADVLHRSAGTKDNFNAYRASLGWKAVGKYADNLITQPWRKEFREIKLYCGFYKHEIEEGLVGAELMLEAMGYRHTGRSTMTLPDILDPDRITSVSKDAIVAYVECVIMKQIWEALPSSYNFTWLDILEFRENHSGTPDQAVRALVYKVRQRQFQEEQYHRSQNVHIPDLPISRSGRYYGHNNTMNYNNHMHYIQQAYTLPVQPRYTVVSPQQPIPPSMMYPSPTNLHGYPETHSVLKSHDLYPSNGYHMHSHYSQIPPPTSHINHNGYSMPNHNAPTISSYIPATVPTAQLIEYDNSSNTNVSSEPFTSTSRLLPTQPIKYQVPPEKHILSEQVSHLSRPESLIPSGRAKEDGAGSWENWDYVYRNLESQGYKKDMGFRGDILAGKSNNFSSSDFSERLKKLNIEASDTITAKKEASKPLAEVSAKMIDASEKFTMREKNERVSFRDPDRVLPKETVERTILRDNTERTPAKNIVEKQTTTKDVTDTLNVKEFYRDPREDVNDSRISEDPLKIIEGFQKGRISPANIKLSIVTNTCGSSRVSPEKPRNDLICRSLDTGGISEVATINQKEAVKPSEERIKADIASLVQLTVNEPRFEEKTFANICYTEPLKWQCVYCTFLNSPNRDICEMCSKSKAKGAEQCPQPSGGQECTACTFVNKPEVTSCIVCTRPLENSPTYI